MKCTVFISIFSLLMITQLLLYWHVTLKNNKYLLIVLFDGFRWDYLNRTETPHFKSIINNGVYATEGLNNEFVTSTLTNHWSIVTGLHPESHGIIENEMFDEEINKTYIPLYRDKNAHNDPRYYDTGVEPIWVTNQLQRADGRSGSIMWWGAENEVKGIRPTYHMPLDLNVDYYFRIDEMIRWFTLSKPINLGLLYFSEPDHTAHLSGPDSENVTQMIKYADDLVGYLIKQLKDKDLIDTMDVIITSDHGFASVSRTRLINLDKFVDPNLYHMVHYTPVAAIIPNKGMEEEVYNKLKEHSEQNHFQVYKKSELPERLHYKHNKRVTPIIAIADITYSFISRMPEDNFTQAGNHGYDNKYHDMHPFFMAFGPSFKQNVKVKTFFSVDLYPLMCHLLNIVPQPNNGSMDNVAVLLEDEQSHTGSIYSASYLIYLLIIAVIILVFTSFNYGYRKCPFNPKISTTRYYSQLPS
uniref:AP3A hydrolase n=1 Tax=Biomphalaria glabrata TaxID=6526 RepID=A0A2C9JT75_BIOGL